MRKTWGWAAAMVASIAAVAVFSGPPQLPPRGPYSAPLLPRIELLKIFGAGQRSLVTDYFWLQAIQSAGRAGESLEKTRWLDLYYYADLVTDLDPKFYKVYGYAGNAVPTNLGRETYVNVDEGIHILEKGVKAFPDDWRLNFYYGAQISYLRKEHKKAAEILRKAATMKDAPPYVSELASRLLAVEGDLDSAYALATVAAAAETDEETRKVLEHRKLEIEQERVLREVDGAIALFQSREGRRPQSTEELVRTGVIAELPEDPLKGEIRIGEDGRSYSTAGMRMQAMDYELTRKRKYEEKEEKK